MPGTTRDITGSSTTGGEPGGPAIAPGEGGVGEGGAGVARAKPMLRVWMSVLLLVRPSDASNKWRPIPTGLRTSFGKADNDRVVVNVREEL